MNKFIRNLLLAVRHIDSFFLEVLLIRMKKMTLNIFEIIENFRHNVCILKNAKSTFFSHFAFAIYDLKELNRDSNNDSNKNSKKEFLNKNSFFRKKKHRSFQKHMRQKALIFQMLYSKQENKIFRMKS